MRAILIILEKSKMLKSLQKKNINNKKDYLVKNLDELDKKPSIFVANEFFDALPLNNLLKKKINGMRDMLFNIQKTKIPRYSF